MLLVGLEVSLDFKIFQVSRQVTCLFEFHLFGDTDGCEFAVHLSVKLVSSNLVLDGSELLSASMLKHDVWLGDFLPLLPGAEGWHLDSAEIAEFNGVYECSFSNL